MVRPAFDGCAQKNKSGRSRPRFQKVVVLHTLDVLSLPALRALNHVELYLLTFLQAAESGRLNRREVYEYILTILAADKPIAFGIVKPLYGPGFIFVLFPFFLNF